MSTRVEKDALGKLDIPENVYYGIHTQRSLQNFDVAGERLPIQIIHAAVRLKRACALANRDLGNLDEELSGAIVTACKRVLAGEFDDQFVIDIFQAGSGTSSNMNINEVVANIANEQMGTPKGKYSPIHPNDHVNMGQSTNNIIPSAIRVACARDSECLLDAGRSLVAGLQRKAEDFEHIFKSGRTHLQDAVPITLGQEFAAYARAAAKSLQRIEGARAMLCELGVGGNAVGTGINTRLGYRELIIEHLNNDCGSEFRVAEDGIEATQFLTDMAHFSSALKMLATDLLKIANDLRLLSSGPNTGLAEIQLPTVEPGSSIMPGKVNPSICEAANMACMKIMGNDHAIALAAAAGQLELNTHMPLVGSLLIDSIGILTRCCTMLSGKCVDGIEADAEKCNHNFQISAGLATVLNPILGYDKVSQLVKSSLRQNRTVKELAIEQGLIDQDAIEKLFNESTGPRD